MTRVHQFLPAIAPHDAISAHALQIRRLLHDLGVESDIFAADVHPRLRDTVRPLTEFRGAPTGDVLLYHASIGSEVAGFVRRRGEPVVVDYHNITAPGLVLPWEPGLAEQLRRGRRELARFADRAVLGIADSEFNRGELDDLGFAVTRVAPILFDFAEFDHVPDPTVAARLQRAKERGGADWLFVGRVSPHKAQHDLIKAFLVYRATFDPNARLHVIGREISTRYLDALEAIAARAGAVDAVELAGGVSAEALAAYYAHADVFVCLSRHEGFCVPLLEAMFHDVPIVAARAGAVAETMGSGGVVLPSAAPSVVAVAVAKVLEDPALRATLVRAGRARLDDFALERTRAQFTAAMGDVLELAESR